MLQQRLCIPEYIEAYQILESLTVLNLLQKNPSKNRRDKVYVQINPEYWNLAKKDLKED